MTREEAALEIQKELESFESMLQKVDLVCWPVPFGAVVLTELWEILATIVDVVLALVSGE